MGEDAVFWCAATGEPLPDITWEFSNLEGELISNEKYNISFYHGSFSRLVVQSVMPEDEGNYTCIAANIYGSVTASAFLQPLGKHY